MTIAKTDQNILDEDTAHELNCRRPHPPFQFRVDADFRGTFTVSLKYLTLGDVHAILKFLEDNHEQWFRK